MKIEYSLTALKQLKKLSKDKQLKVLKVIENLKNNPFGGKKLKGEFEGLYSLKVWPYRVIYHYFSKEKLLFINVIQHRQEVYK
jgi:addiction module RelE/StbE family toxin